MLQNKSFHFTLPPDTFTLPAVFKGSNAFDYFNIFDYFMNGRITTVTFVQSKGILPLPKGRRKYFNALRFSHSLLGKSENGFIFDE
jgi:hypothetical protein